jgi:hypothetical protein
MYRRGYIRIEPIRTSAARTTAFALNRKIPIPGDAHCSYYLVIFLESLVTMMPS